MLFKILCQPRRHPSSRFAAHPVEFIIYIPSVPERLGDHRGQFEIEISGFLNGIHIN